MKLNKQELNELIYKIKQDNPTYGLIMEIAYIYARNISEVGNLQTSNINYFDNTITFHVFNQDYKPVTYPLHQDIMSDLEVITEDKTDDEYIFDEYFPHENTRKLINNYLTEKVSKIPGLDFVKLKGLTSQDFRILRGQHLYSDGVKLSVLRELYAHSKISSTQNLIDYNQFQEESTVKSIDDVFKEYTDLNVFCEWDYYNYQSYYCSYDGADALIEVDNGNVNIIGDNSVRERLVKVSDLKSLLSRLRNVGDYKFIRGVKVLKQ